ncbi:MAG: hypothetical protein HY646_07570 [Acidobacteria bacterium]|nr:hypothetical protein [Acidobacteriota bacterium]
MFRDLRHAARMILRAKGWTAVVPVLLAFGIEANTALFSAINGLLLRTSPVAHPESLARFRWSGDHRLAEDVSDQDISENNSA